MLKVHSVFWWMIIACPLVTACGAKFPFLDRSDGESSADQRGTDPNDSDASPAGPNQDDRGADPHTDEPPEGEGSDDGTEDHSEQPGGDSSEYTLSHLFDATDRAVASFPRGQDDPDACSKTPAIVRGHDDISEVTSWQAPEYDLWVRVNYTNQCNDEQAKIYFWCHFHSGPNDTKHIACHARGVATIDWDRLNEPACEPADDCGGNDNGGDGNGGGDDGGGGIPL